MSSHDRRPGPEEAAATRLTVEPATIDGLYAVFVDAMADGIVFLSAIRDDAAEIVDFRIDYVNDAFTAMDQATLKAALADGTFTQAWGIDTPPEKIIGTVASRRPSPICRVVGPRWCSWTLTCRACWAPSA